MSTILEQFPALNEKYFTMFIELTHSVTGITISRNRKAMLEGRIRKRLMRLSIKTFEEYYEYLNSNEEEVKKFIEVITTNETLFFRTPRV